MKIKAIAPAIQSIIDEAPRPSLIVVGAIFDASFMFHSVRFSERLKERVQQFEPSGTFLFLAPHIERFRNAEAIARKIIPETRPNATIAALVCCPDNLGRLLQACAGRKAFAENLCPLEKQKRFR